MQRIFFFSLSIFFFGGGMLFLCFSVAHVHSRHFQSDFDSAKRTHKKSESTHGFFGCDCIRSSCSLNAFRRDTFMLRGNVPHFAFTACKVRKRHFEALFRLVVSVTFHSLFFFLENKTIRTLFFFFLQGSYIYV